MVRSLMMSGKLDTLFWDKNLDVIIYFNDFTNIILSFDSSYILCVIQWTMFGNCSRKEYSITSQKKNYLCSWFQFNSLRLVLGMDLNIYTSVTKDWKIWTKILKVFGLFSTFLEVTGERLVNGGLFTLTNLSLHKKNEVFHSELLQ